MGTIDDPTLEALAARVGEALVRGQAVLATAESCTGGWIGAAVTAIAGSSAWFDRGFVTYSNDAKVAMLGVAPETLACYGAVSAETVGEMARGALARSRARISVAVSGIAGPGGGTPDKPVGTVFVAWADTTGRLVAERLQLPGDRHAVRRATVVRALEGVVALLG
jgi:nicotinamide-nucleotide amidase